MPGIAVKYTDQQRLEAVKLFIACGSESQVSQLTSIPRETIKEWRKAQWWRDEMKAALAERDFKLQQAFTDVIEDAAKIVKDRLTNGDPYINRQGEVITKPIAAKDAALIVAIFHDKRRDARNQEVQLENLQTSNQILNELAEKFGSLVKKEPPKIIDVEPEQVSYN